MLLPFLGPGHSWPARTILAGGGPLAALAAWLAFRPGRRDDAGPPWAAAVALGVLAGVPAAASRDGAIARGLVLLLGLAAFLAGPSRPLSPPRSRHARALRPRRRPALPRARLLPAVGRVRGGGPHPGGLAGELRLHHGYGPITWPRTGRELFRVRAPRRRPATGKPPTSSTSTASAGARRPASTSARARRPRSPPSSPPIPSGSGGSRSRSAASPRTS